MRRRVSALFVLIFIELAIHAQIGKTPIPYTSIREADIIWAKRIWRVIDIREKINQPYYFPIVATASQQSLFDILKKGVFSGKLKAFTEDDISAEFNKPIGVDAFSKMVVTSDSITVYDMNERGEEITSKKLATDTLGAENIVQYWIKEDWFFDKQRSVMDVRIIGICPVRYDLSKELLIPMFWIYYPESRAWLNSFSAINSKNDAEPRTFDELFVKRKFSSYIKKESNIFDRNIDEYAKGIDALLESERIKNEMINFECDMWQY